MKLTDDSLYERGACYTEVEIFATEWPDGAEVTLENCQRAAELGLDLDWLAEKVLPAPALAEYERATAPASAEYRRATAAAFFEAVTQAEQPT